MSISAHMYDFLCFPWYFAATGIRHHMTTTTPLPGQTALTCLYACRAKLLRAETVALDAADHLTGPRQRRVEDLAKRLAYTTALVNRLALAVQGDL